MQTAHFHASGESSGRHPPSRAASVTVRIFATAAALLAATSSFAASPSAHPARGSIDVCAGLVTDTAAHPQPASPRPAKGTTVIDPTFGTRVIRITDVRKDFDAEVAKTLYSTTPAWNADESRMLIWVRGSDKGHALLDGRSYRFIRWLDIDPADLEQVYWDPIDPDILWFPHSNERSGRSVRQLVRYHVAADREEVWHDFSNAGQPRAWAISMGGDPMYPSWDMKLWGIQVHMKPEGEFFAFRADRREEGPRVSGSRTPVPCPSGRCMWQPLKRGSRLLEPATLSPLRELSSWGGEHGDLGMNLRGEDFFASVQFDGRVNGTIVIENLQTAEVRTLVGPATGYPYPHSGTHLSAVAFRNPGWIAASSVGNPSGRKVLEQEIVLANADSGKVCRIAHHHSAGKSSEQGYWAEPHVTISPSATRVAFSSDWGRGDSVDVYVVELPAYLAEASTKGSPPAR